MKKIIFTFISALFAISFCANLSYGQYGHAVGWLRYAGQETNTNYPLTNTDIKLKDPSTGQVLCDDWTNSVGVFSVLCGNGTYNAMADVQKPICGVNATDALLIVLHAVGSTTLSAFSQILADVNNSGTINSGDAFKVMQRMVGTITTWPNGVKDWYGEPFGTTNPITIASGNTTCNIHAACMGDVNLTGATCFYQAKLKPSVHLNTYGIMHVKSGKSFDLPIVSLDKLDAGAISMVLSFPTDKYQLNSIQFPSPNSSGSADSWYDIINDRLGMAWYNINGVKINADDTLLIINLSAYNQADTGNGIEIVGETEIADHDGNPYDDVELEIEKVAIIKPSTTELDINVYPNPANEEVEFTYTLPVDGDVRLIIYDILGHEVAQIINKQQVANVYHKSFKVSNLTDGVYTYRFIFNDFMKTGRLVVNR